MPGMGKTVVSRAYPTWYVVSPQHAPNQEPALELHSRAAPSVEAHHHVNGPDTGRNSRGRWIIFFGKILIFYQKKWQYLK